MDGLTAFDDALIGRLAQCAYCGTRPPAQDLWGDMLDVGALRVHIVLCPTCCKRWATVQAQVLTMLQQRYQVTGGT
jgi:hypothetical protein